MKLTLLFLFISFLVKAQSLTPSFSAIIVSDMDESLNWYQEKLGYQILNDTENPERGFRQANLSRGDYSIELIELENALDLSQTLEGYNARTRWQGLFKIGYTVTDFDTWIAHLQEVKAEFHGNVVSMNGKRMVIVKDPDGNRIQIFEK